jgi:hypothetical protein
MKIEEGKKYVKRDGRVSLKIKEYHSILADEWVFRENGLTYRKDGTWDLIKNKKSRNDLIKEYKPKNKMKDTVKVKKQFLLDGHKEACKSWKERIEKEAPELFGKPELVKGEWYSVSHGKTMFLFNGEVDEDGDPLGVGFDFHGKWVGEDGIAWLCNFGIEKSTKEEITSALIAEAKRRGFEKGVRINKLLLNNCGSERGDRKTLESDEFLYNGTHLFCENLMLFHETEGWAEILEDKNDSLKASVKALEEQLKELKRQIG